MKSVNSSLTPQMIVLFCERRLTPVLPAHVVRALQGYLTDLLAQREFPPYRGTCIDLEALAKALSVDVTTLRAAKIHLRPIFDAVARAVADAQLRPQAVVRVKRERKKPTREAKLRSGRRPKPIVEFPEPLETIWDEPADFGSALRLHAARHGESIYHLCGAVVRPEDGMNRSTLISWARGAKAPRSVLSLEILRRIERRYRLPEGYFSEMAANPARAATG